MMRPRSLGAYLALAFTLLSVLFTIILVEVVERAGTEEVKNSIGHGLGELAMQTADKLDRGMFERYREVSLLAERSGLVGPNVETAQRRAILEQVQRSYGYYAWIGLVDMQGAVHAATGGLLEGANVGQRPWYKNALAGQNVDDVHEAVLLAKLLPKQDEPRRFVDVAFPYRGPDGKPAGVLGAHLSWEWARDVERSIIAPIAARGRVDALILSASGKVLLGPKDVLGTTLAQPSFKAAQRDGDGYMVEKWPDGSSYLVGYSRSKGFRDYAGLGWTVLVRQNVDDAYEPVRRLRRHALWSGLGLAFVFSLAGIIAAHRITRPLGDLARSAQRIQKGESVPLESGTDSFFEVEALAGSLNALVADLVRRRGELQELNASLEQRVEARTRELEQAMQTLRESGERIATIIEASNDAFISADLNGRITDWNTQAQKMFGWTREEVLGQPVTMLLPERFRAGMRAAVAAFRDTGHSGLLEQRLERVVVHRDGTEFPVEMSASLAGEGGNAF
ncbi:MAG TPA: PAS domain S-box protein, partial [Telluria sp.]|nr:PAS domain S-box protein [Telluria sp.]